MPFGQRELPNPKFAFQIDFPPGTTQVYLRVRSHSALNVPLFVVTPAEYVERQQTERLFLAIAFGLFLVLLTLNVVFFIVIRDRNILIYLFYLVNAAVFVSIFTGYAFKYAWPQAPYWNAASNSIVYVILQTAGMAFIQNFLRTRLHMPGFNRLINASYGAIGATLLLVPFSLQWSEAYVAAVSLPLCLIVILYPCFRLLFRGHLIARFYLVGWLGLCGSMAVYVLQIFGFLPTRLFGLDQMQYPVAGFMLEMIFFPLALGDRLAMILREARAAAANPDGGDRPGIPGAGSSRPGNPQPYPPSQAVRVAPVHERLSRLTRLSPKPPACLRARSGRTENRTLSRGKSRMPA